MALSTLRHWLRRSSSPIRKPGRFQRRPQFDSLETRYAPATITVGPNDSVQAAITAASSGDTIRVLGVHKEQIVINDIGHERDDLKIVAGNPHAAIVAPDNIAAPGSLIQISGSQNVTIRGLTIKGPAETTTPDLYGILVNGGGSAKIVGNRISNITDDPLSGVQRGIAIYIGGDGGGSATIDGNLITRYQKAGIVVSGADSTATIDDNVVYGQGPTTVIAQNGVQISDGATAKITDNVIAGNTFTPNTFAASGILLDASGKVTIEDNVVSRNSIGIFVSAAAEGLVIKENVVARNDLLGIYLDSTSGAKLLGNIVSFNGSSDPASVGGIALGNSTNNRIEGNISFHNTGYGLALDSNSTGNTITRNRLFRNSVFDAADGTTGSGTQGTANTWTKNFGVTSDPLDLVSKRKFFVRFHCSR